MRGHAKCLLLMTRGRGAKKRPKPAYVIHGCSLNVYFIFKDFNGSLIQNLNMDHLRYFFFDNRMVEIQSHNLNFNGNFLM